MRRAIMGAVGAFSCGFSLGVLLSGEAHRQQRETLDRCLSSYESSNEQWSERFESMSRSFDSMEASFNKADRLARECHVELARRLR